MRLSRTKLLVLGSLWIAAIFASMFMMMKYESTPGRSANAPHQWPLNSAIKLDQKCFTLIMLAHPQCPCTNASIAELSKIMTKCQSKVHAYVVFLRPKSLPPHWQEKTEPCSNAQAILGVTVLNDFDGAEARNFNSTTSGQTLIYSPDGKLCFNGGITCARGQIGDNSGSQSIIQIVNGNLPSSKATMVFGCPLTDLDGDDEPPEQKLRARDKRRL